MNFPSHATVLLIMHCCLLLPAQLSAQANATPEQQPQAQAAPAVPYVLHLPGIGGRRGLDRAMVRGLQFGGFTEHDTYDWTENDPGLNALLAIKRNRQQARHVAQLITDIAARNPRRQINLVAHSGGTGIAVWALESLPPEVKVHNLVLLSSALSPDYDLSEALRHVEHKAYAFTSMNDTLVLGVGTKMFGTIDGKKVEAGGRVGFVVPPTADAEQYEKFVQFPYDPAFLKYGNLGDHIGPMRMTFAEDVLAPLLLRDVAPPTSPVTPATKPVRNAPVQRVGR
ncbi:MAG TPA: alpha/beta fold hydrolase [Tepidisphaeraceae bacterium]|jgi:pimeloyl-ACP methyl ester carboxylesterase|nr:alpha/beta fold hydrolase [Tepidisphaeraceae bacterium]